MGLAGRGAVGAGRGHAAVARDREQDAAAAVGQHAVLPAGVARLRQRADPRAGTYPD